MKCCLITAFLSLKDAVSNSDHFLERGESTGSGDGGELSVLYISI